MHLVTPPFEDVLLQTKLYRPREMRAAIDRPRLRTLLNAGLDKPLTLVTAPSGYGKTTLVGSWLATEGLSAAWLSLDAQDNDLATFVKYFVAALRTVSPDCGHNALALVDSPQNPPPTLLADTLVRDLANLPDLQVMVLDDYHEISDGSIHKFIDRLVKYMPSHASLVIIGRTAPPLSLGRLRAQERLHEIATFDIAFTHEEAGQLLCQAAGRILEPRVIDLLEDRTEGWAAGLQLAGLSARTNSSENLFTQLAALGNGPVVDYLIEEVAELIPPTMRDFLLRTSILSRFNADLCAAVVAGSEGGQQPVESTLERVMAANLFIVPLDERQEWFRYHHLFQDVLQRYLAITLTQAEIADLHRRASDWYVNHGLMSEAIRHAVAAGDDLVVAQIVETHYQVPLNREDWRRLSRWLDQVPPTVQDRPALLIIRGLVERLRFRMAAVQNYAELAETALSLTTDSELTVDRQTLLGELYGLYASTAYWREDIATHKRVLQGAISRIAFLSLYSASVIELQRANGLETAGRSDEALAYLQGRLEAHPNESDPLAMRLLLGMCSIYGARGDLAALKRTGETYLRRAIANDKVISEGWANLSLAYVAYEWQDLPAAEDGFRRIVALPFALSAKCAVDGYIGLCLTLAAGGRHDEANAMLAELRQFISDGGNTPFVPIANSLERRLALARAQGEGSPVPAMPPAVPFMGPMGLAYQEYPPHTEARLLIALGTDDALQSAIEILSMAEQRAHRLHANRRLIEVGALRALALNALGHSTAALDALDEVLDLAEPGHFVGTFVDCGPGMVPLLEQLIADNRHAAYAAELLTAFARSTAIDRGLADSVDTLLTNRELDVLERLARRMSNKEIAAELYVSPQTVKTHAQNLYNKLGVSNRREAVVMAQRLRLLG